MRKRTLSFLLAICLMLTLAPQVFAAGDSIHDATEITLGSTNNGSISETNTVNYYKFTLPSSGRVNFSATAWMHWIYYTIYDGTGTQLWRTNPSWNSTSEIIATNVTFDFTAGTYYLAVSKDGSNTGDFSFTFNFTSANESFAETGNGTNNSMNTANQISLNKDYLGQLALNDDKDFFEFTLPSSGRITFTATARMHWIYYTVYDSAGNQLWRKNPSWNSTSELIATNEIIDLTKGTYYLAVSKDGSSTGNFSINLAFESANESFEESASKSDNDIYSANAVSLNTTYRGQLAVNDEKDFYQFTVPVSGKMSFTAVAEMNWIYYTIYDFEGNQVWRKNPHWNDTSKQIITNELIDLSQGTYYLAVSRNGSYTGNYKIFLSKGSNFKDVPSGIYYEPAVNWAVAKEITFGTTETSFSPNANVTRAQAVSFLWRAMGKPSPKNMTSPFSDVKSDYYYDAVLWAVEQGITVGTSATTFSPNASVTRVQMIAFLYRTLGEPGKTGQGEWYTDAENWAKREGILAGTSVAYTPFGDCPRSDVVFYLWGALSE